MAFFRRAANPAEIEHMRAEMAALREAIEQHDSTATKLESRLRSFDGEPKRDPRLEKLSTTVAELDARVTAVSTELANQLTELGRDIDSLGARPPADGSAAAVGELRDGQVRLANEQARYQMAFREDLARLADELKRSR
jgi:predicted RNase H-like nuclease (RuvC/YqgF family)